MLNSARSRRAQIIRHVAELPQHDCITKIAGRRITSATERDRTGMTQYFPKTLSTRYRGCRAWAFNGFTSNNAVVGGIERQGNEIADSGYEFSLVGLETPRYCFPFVPNVNFVPIGNTVLACFDP